MNNAPEFPLYKAPLEKSPSYVGKSISSLTGIESDHCFKMYIGDRIRYSCHSCGETCSVDCGNSNRTTCPLCGEKFFGYKDDEIHITYEEFRAGFGLMTKDTVIGMISDDHLVDGWSHGSPSESPLRGFKTRNDGEWYQAYLGIDTVYELLRTPSYDTWQGDRWQFYNQKPMAFVGEWDRGDFEKHRGNKTIEEFYIQVLGEEFVDVLAYVDNVCKYVFQSLDDGTYLGHFDFD